MRRSAKTKALATRIPLRKSALTATAAARRHFPAWIDAAERVVPFAATAVQPRVRDGLVLRRVGAKKAAGGKEASDGSRAR